ncbi:hypothetical protein [Phytopseudomonas seleniipraecipitans]|uniref:Uncharacterized protein n=1 Tax=Phytopseudomonas seleniipraecipitans TaxID=640205 RepID=A0A1G7RQ06_9GAMM|nr:hypothetical protein [Pseudomonas seleniipraecipitans]SDG12896.1 hypothetical protein SAMN05216381_3230 [Pseudomonas seleniipraecipitans]
MSQMHKVVRVVKNYKDSVRGNSATLLKRVRAEDESGATVYYKDLLIPDYLKSKGAFSKDVPRTWYVKETSKNVTVVVGFAKNSGEFFYDNDEIKGIARGARVQGVIFGAAAVPAGVIVGIATYGVGLLITPWLLFLAYRFFIKIPAVLGQKTLQRDFQEFGIKI